MIIMLSNKRFIDYLDNKFIHKNCDLFITYENGTYVACDNSTGNKWVEEFNHLEKAVSWLKGERIIKQKRA